MGSIAAYVLSLAAGCLSIISIMVLGWLGVSAWRDGRRIIGVVLLAAPLLFGMLLPAVSVFLPAHALRAGVRLSGVALIPISAVIALLFRRRYLTR
jgi:hypothetical protein